MKITSNKVDDLNQVLTVCVDAADYEPSRKKKLNEMQRKAEVPGFRKGHVPASLVEKWYGATALGDSVNEVVSKALQDYVSDNSLDIIGEPLPCEEHLDQEWKAGNAFSFNFEIALTPVVEFELGKSDELPFYNINVTVAEKKKLVDAYKAQQNDTPEEEIEKMVTDQLTEEYKSAAEYRFQKDLREFCINKAGGIALPDKFLRRWLLAVNEGKFTAEQIDKDFEGFLADYRWQLVMNYLLKKYDVKIEEADITEEARLFARYQYSMYGIANPPEDAVEAFVKNNLQDRASVERMVENVQNRKAVEAAKEQITVKPKKISLDKFKELNKAEVSAE